MILERILTGVYEPGERLVETRLAKEFETSQVPVREALRELEVLRFVESEPFRGARVRAVSRAEMVEIFPVRSAIEEVAVRLATVQLDGDVEELERHLGAMEKAAADGDLQEQVDSDVAFHRTIVEDDAVRVAVLERDPFDAGRVRPAEVLDGVYMRPDVVVL